MITLIATTLRDELLERIRQNFYDAIRELQLLPAAQLALIENVELADGIPTPIAHGRGRKVRVFVSPVRGASTSGRIEEMRDGYRRDTHVTLKATGFGATVTVDLVVL